MKIVLGIVVVSLVLAIVSTLVVNKMSKVEGLPDDVKEKLEKYN